MTQHTPGPWEIEQIENRICISRPKPAHRIVATINEEGLAFFLSVEEDANARLIAAAPDLLEAASAVLDETNCLEPALKDVLQDAITKAIGYDA